MSTPVSGISCPLPDPGRPDKIMLAHGEGGRLMRRLIREHIFAALGNDQLQRMDDAAILEGGMGRLAVSTDSFVVSPLFFPGGDIGKLAVYGTANDLAVSGARPRWLSLALVIEEGLSLATLDRVLHSAASAAQRIGMRVVAGDTKVVPKGAADGLFITATGLGEVMLPPPPGPASLVAGSDLVVSGPIGQHGMAVLTSREGLEFRPEPSSDCAPLFDAVCALRDANIPVLAMRDATRGGMAAVLQEWAEASGHTMSLDEQLVPVSPGVRAACEVLGLDPIHVANEGTMIVAVEGGWAERAVQVLRQIPETTGAAFIGQVRARTLAPVLVRRALGSELPLDEPLGAPLPRIC